MSIKITTLLKKIDLLHNQDNASVIMYFYDYMREKGSSENHIMNNLKVIIEYVNYLNETKLYEVDKREHIVPFLNIKIKDGSTDPDKRWITTWNHYLNRLKLFFRWLHSYHKTRNTNSHSSYDGTTYEDWFTPNFIKIKQKQTKRLSPYSETEIWERDELLTIIGDELLTIIGYEPVQRNKAVISLMWDIDARPHEITLLKIKHIRLKKEYAEGEIPHQAKTGSGPMLLTFSFPYVRDWLNVHPFKNEPEARLICNLHNGSPISPNTLWNLMEQLKRRIERLVKSGEITNKEEAERIRYLLLVKKWNPYCIRHSAITADSDFLPDYALKKKVRWSMNSKQGSRYIKQRRGNELKNKILEYNGINAPAISNKKRVVLICSRCELTNAMDNKYCSQCSYPLLLGAYEEIKEREESKFKELEMKHNQDMMDLKHHIEEQLEKVWSFIDLQKLT